MSLTSRDLCWLSYFQNVAVAACVDYHAAGGVQAAEDFGKAVVEAAEAVEVTIEVVVGGLGVVIVVVVPVEVVVVHNLFLENKNLCSR